MAYQCNDASCRPCKHEQTKQVCPSCSNTYLVIAPHREWIYCPNWTGCGWETYYRDDINYELEIPTFSDEYKAEAEQRIRDYSSKQRHTKSKRS